MSFCLVLVEDVSHKKHTHRLVFVMFLPSGLLVLFHLERERERERTLFLMKKGGV